MGCGPSLGWVVCGNNRVRYCLGMAEGPGQITEIVQSLLIRLEEPSSVCLSAILVTYNERVKFRRCKQFIYCCLVYLGCEIWLYFLGGL